MNRPVEKARSSVLSAVLSSVLPALAFALLVHVVAGCTPSVPTPVSDLTMAPTGDLAGADLTSVCTYPSGPYGTATDSVIANLAFQIKHNAMTQGGQAATAAALADLHCDGIKVFAILVSAEWCLPCQAEQPELVQLYTDYMTAGKKVAFVEFIVQNNDHSPGDSGTLDRWASKFKIPFDMGVDVNNALAPYYDANNFPAEMVIQTSDMTIQAARKGYQMGWLKDQIDGLVQ